MKWSNVQTAEKKSPKTTTYTATCVGALLCEECATTELCSTCAELWESEIDLEDMEAEEE